MSESTPKTSLQGETLPDANEGCVGPSSDMAGRASACAGCPNQSLCASGKAAAPDPYLDVIRARLNSVRHVVLVLSGKGGVGKSTLTKELGFAAARRDLMVGLLDSDICGPSLPRMTGCRDESVHNTPDGWLPVAVDDNVVVMSTQFLLADPNEAIVWRGPRKNSMIKNFFGQVEWGSLDLLLVDTPPGTSDEHLSIVNILRSTGNVDGAIIITTPQEVAVSDVRREINFCRKSKIPILGVVENMTPFVCPRCNKTSEVFPRNEFDHLGAGERLSKDYDIPYLGTIPLDRALMLSCEEGIPVVEYAPEGCPSANAITELADLLFSHIGCKKQRIN